MDLSAADLLGELSKAEERIVVLEGEVASLRRARQLTENEKTVLAGHEDGCVTAMEVAPIIKRLTEPLPTTGASPCRPAIPPRASRNPSP